MVKSCLVVCKGHRGLSSLAKHAPKRWWWCIFSKFLKQGPVSSAWSGEMRQCHMAVPQATREKSCPALCSSAHPIPSSLWKDFSTGKNALLPACRAILCSGSAGIRPKFLRCWFRGRDSLPKWKSNYKYCKCGCKLNQQPAGRGSRDWGYICSSATSPELSLGCSWAARGAWEWAGVCSISAPVPATLAASPVQARGEGAE